MCCVLLGCKSAGSRSSASQNRLSTTSTVDPQYIVLAKQMQVEGKKLESNAWTKEIFSPTFDVFEHRDVLAGEGEEDESGMALGDLVGALDGGTIVTTFYGVMEATPATSKLGIEFLRNCKRVKVAHNSYALYWVGSGASTGSASAIGTVAAGGAVAAGVAVVGYLVYEYSKAAREAQKAGKNLTPKEKAESWSGSNSYWSNFCRYYSIGC